MRRIGVVDLPFDVDAYLALASEENWSPGAAAVPLLRPATFLNMEGFRRFYRECVAATAGDNPAAAAGWACRLHRFRVAVRTRPRASSRAHVRHRHR